MVGSIRSDQIQITNRRLDLNKISHFLHFFVWSIWLWQRCMSWCMILELPKFFRWTNIPNVAIGLWHFWFTFDTWKMSDYIVWLSSTNSSLRSLLGRICVFVFSKKSFTQMNYRWAFFTLFTSSWESMSLSWPKLSTKADLLQGAAEALNISSLIEIINFLSI